MRSGRCAVLRCSGTADGGESRRWLRVIIGLGAAIAVLGGETAGLRADAPTPVATARESYAEFGVLETQVRQLRRPSCWTLLVRGVIVNPYDKPVQGARLIVRLRTTGEETREVDRLETEVRRDIGPRAEAPFSRELTTSCTSVFTSLSVVAFAIERGGVELPVPSSEVEIAATSRSPLSSEISAITLAKRSPCM